MSLFYDHQVYDTIGILTAADLIAALILCGGLGKRRTNRGAPDGGTRP